MSPLSRTDLQVLLAPGRLLVASAGWTFARGRAQRRLRALQCIDCAAAPGEPAWGGALRALGGQLGPRARLHVTLSNRLVRYAPVPWQAALRGEAEWAAYARECLRQLYGAGATGWEVRVGHAPAGQARLASAIDAALLAALRELCASSGALLAVLRPQLMEVFNAYRRRLRADCGWLLLAEPACLCGALFDAGGWRRAGLLASGPGWQEGLDALLARETLLADPAGEVTQVYLWQPQADGPAPAAIAGWPVVALAAPSAPGSPGWHGLRPGSGSGA